MSLFSSPGSQVRIAKSSAPPSQSAFSSQGHSSTGKKANWSWEEGSQRHAHRPAACPGHAHRASGSLPQHLGSAPGSHPAFLAQLLSAKSAFQKLPRQLDILFLLYPESLRHLCFLLSRKGSGNSSDFELVYSHEHSPEGLL